MPESTTVEDQELTTETTNEASEESTDTNESGSVNQPEPSAIDELPKWAQEQIHALRAESAEKRKRLKEVEERLSSSVSTEDYERVQRELVRTRIAAETGLPDALAARLTGSTEEEMRKDAESLRQFIGRPGNGPKPTNSVDPGLKGGITPEEQRESDFFKQLDDRFRTRKRFI